MLLEFIATTLFIAAALVVVTALWLCLRAQYDMSVYSDENESLRAQEWAQKMGEEPEDWA